MNNKNNRPFKDERDQKIQIKSESHALGFVIAAAQIMTVICLLKKNSAWMGSLSLMFIGAAAELFYKYQQYEEKPYLYIGVTAGLIGIGLLFWFGFTGL